MPVAVTENVAVWPTLTDWLAGWDVMLGGPLTVRVAGLLATLWVECVTVTLNVEPLSALVAAGVV